jgi:pre-mRNA-splicing factor CWC22
MTSVEKSKPTLTGGAYIPPAKLKLLQQAISDKNSIEYQRLAWEALKKSIHGLVNKVNIPNIAQVVRELFKENIVRGRGLLCRSIMQAQLFSPTFTNVYASLIAIINMKFPQIGELILKRCIVQFKMSYKQNKKEQCLSTCKFIGHLINQNVAHEILALQILTLLLENPTNHSVEVAIGLLKECGKKLSLESPRSLHAIFETLRNILNQQASATNVDDKRIQYMIEVMFAVRKDGFKDYPVVLKELDLVEETEQYTHFLSIEDEYETENTLNIFKLDDKYEENEEKYKILKKEILDESDSDESDGSGSSDDDEDDDDDEENEDEETKKKTDEKVSGMIIDETETNLVSLRRTIYLTIQSSLDFQECAHKLLKMNIKESQQVEVCQMILDACAQQRTYERFFGLLGQRFCELKKEYVECFEEIFKQQYETCHRLETVKLRNVSRFLSHLLYTDSISWGVFDCVHLNEEETTSSSRVYLKNLLLDLSEHMGMIKMRERFNDITLQEFFQGLFPRDNPRNTRFAINFFTSIGLGPLTDELREHLKLTPKLMPPVALDSSESDHNKSDPKIKLKKHIKSEESDSDNDSSDEKSSRKKKKKEKKKQKSRKSSDDDDSADDDERKEKELLAKLKRLEDEQKEMEMREKLIKNLKKVDEKRRKRSKSNNSSDNDDDDDDRRRRDKRKSDRYDDYKSSSNKNSSSSRSYHNNNYNSRRRSRS